MLPRFADIFQQGNRWLNWLEKQPEGSVRPVVTESVTKNHGMRDHADGLHAMVLFVTGLLPHQKDLLPV